MKYRIKSLYIVKGRKITTKLRARRRSFSSSQELTILPPILKDRYEGEYIDLDMLFALGELTEAKPTHKKRHHKKGRIKKRAASLRALTVKLYLRLKARSAIKAQRPQRLAFLSGVLVSAVLVTVLCVAGVLAKPFIPYMRSYTPITVPYFVGESIYTVESTAPEEFELLVSYEANPSIEAGVVISQRPEAGVVRKIFKNGEPCIITVTVSTGKNYYTVENFVGKDSRLSLLSLYNQGVSVKEEYVYSDTVPEGTVIGSTPSHGATLYEDEVLSLKISLGKRIVTVSMPDLYGLSEAQARSLLSEKGLVLGDVTYATSSAGAGKIIRQQYSPYEKVAKGSTVNITVSLGSEAEQKTVPDLYGLTAEGAAQRLAEVGLVIGNIYHEVTGAPKGTVVMQTPLAGTPITSSITSVDIYIAS